MELARGLATRLTHETGNVMVWSPDGRQIAYHDSTTTRLFVVGVDGDRPQLVLESKSLVYVNDWSPDGRFLMYTETSPTTGNDLWLLPTTGDRTPVPFLVTPFGESHGQFSPDGTWVAYTSNESGQEEIYVRTMTGKGGSRVSTSGGSYSRWRHDGRELFYRSTNGRLMAAPVVNAGGRLTVGTPVPLFPIVEPLGTFAYPYDVAPDGQKFLALTSGSTERDRALTVIVKWESGLRKSPP
jgi:Tol biopolymer transport system component